MGVGEVFHVHAPAEAAHGRHPEDSKQLSPLAGGAQVSPVPRHLCWALQDTGPTGCTQDGQDFQREGKAHLKNCTAGMQDSCWEARIDVEKGDRRAGK